MQPFTIPRLFDFNKKPVDQVVLDYSNHLTNKLRHAFIFQETRQASSTSIYHYFDHASQLRFTSQRNVTANFNGRQSAWLNFGGSGGIPINNGVINNGFFAFGNEVSVTCRVFYRSLTQDHTLLDISDQQLTFWADTNASQLRTTVYPQSASYGTDGELDSPPWVSWGGSCKNTGTTNNVRAYVDGVLANTSDGIGNAFWTTSKNYRFGINYNGSFKTSNAYYEYIYCWDKELSAEEFRAIQLEPYQIFKPAIPIAYFIPDAAVGAAGATKNLPLMGCG